jgi:amidase
MADLHPLSTVSTVDDDALGSDDLSGLLDRLARREVSPSELRAAALARARRADATLNAVAAWADPEAVTDVAPQPGSAFAGVPTLVKDNDDLAGHPTRQGSRALPDVPAATSSPFAAQLLELGFVAVAKTTMPEFGLTASTESSLHGATANPWDVRRSAGGSSGGSAALVAAGVVPLAHANDGGGSIRIPAACCGLVGLTPTRGRTVDRPEVARLPVQISRQGVLTRTVRDTARFYAELEAVAPSPTLPPVGDVRAPGAVRLRVGLVTRSIKGLPVDEPTTAAVTATGALLERLGHHVDEAPPPVDDRFGPDFLHFWLLIGLGLQYGGARVNGPGFDPSLTEAFTRGLASRAVAAAPRIPGSLRRLRRLARDHEAAFETYDLLLSPVLGHVPPPLGYLGPDVPFDEHLVRLLRFISFTPVQNVSGSPALSLPMGRTPDGLPLGVQLTAPFGLERRLLEVAYELEEAAPWPLTPPGGLPDASPA